MNDNAKEVRARILDRMNGISDDFGVFRRKWRAHNPDETDLGILQAYLFWRLAEIQTVVEIVAGRQIAWTKPEGFPGQEL